MDKLTNYKEKQISLLTFGKKLMSIMAEYLKPADP